MSSGVRTIERLVPVRELGSADRSRPRGASRAYAGEVPPHLAARGVGEILDAAWGVLAARFAGCIGVAFALTLPARLSVIALQHSAVAPTTRHLAALVVPRLVELLVAVLLAKLVRDHLAGRSCTARESVRHVLPRFLPLAIPLGLLAAVQGCLGELVVCCFPAVFLIQWQLSVVPAVCAIERVSVVQSVLRGMKLVWGLGNLGRFLGWYLVQGIMFLGVASATEAVEHPDVRATVLSWLPIDGLTLDVLTALPLALLMAVAAAYPAVTMTVYYFDTRVRGEAYDLDVKLAERAERAPAEGTS